MPIFQLCPLGGLKSYDAPMAMIIPSAKTLVSKYHASLKVLLGNTQVLG